jgi:hypothetical protein
LTQPSYDGDEDTVPAVAPKTEESAQHADIAINDHPESADASAITNYADYDNTQNDLQQQQHSHTNNGMEHMMDEGQHSGGYNNDAQPEERLIGMKEDG